GRTKTRGRIGRSFLFNPAYRRFAEGLRRRCDATAHGLHHNLPFKCRHYERASNKDTRQPRGRNGAIEHGCERSNALIEMMRLVAAYIIKEHSMSPPKRIAYIIAAFFVASLFFSWLLTRGTHAPERQTASLTQTSNANNSNMPQTALEENAGVVEP